MSRQPSPGPSAPTHPTSYYRDAHGLPIEKTFIKIVYRGGDQPAAPAQAQQGASAPVPGATSSSSARTKGRTYQSGIAAGAEDVKYAAKYRDLKQKVKEIEADNDRLTFKVMQAKRSIQRAKLERAILYERLGALPASPPPANAPLPPQHPAQQVPPGGQVPRHPDAQSYGQPGRRQHLQGPPAPHHHHHQHHQQPIQPAPPSHISPTQHHPQAHHQARDAAHPGQLPITHAPQVCTIQTPEGPLLVVAGPDGRPVTTADGHVIPAQDIHGPPPPPSAPQQRKRGGRVSKEVREMREREAREMREREELERKRDQALLATASGGHAPGQPLLEPPQSSSSSRSHSAHMQGVSPQLPPQAQAPGAPQITPMSSREQREQDWEIERAMRDRERMQRREGREDEQERSVVAPGLGHHHHSGHAHAHGHRYHPQQVPERTGSPPPPPPGPSPVQTSPPQGRRSHSQASHYSGQSYGSHQGHGHHVHSHHSHSHSHSHSGSPRSPGGSTYPTTRIHGHQRIGPGSYVMRDRADAPPAEHAPAAPTPASTASQQNDEAPAPPPTTASSSRVPTPPYMQRPVRTELFNNHVSPVGEDAGPSSGAKSEAHPSEDGSGARSASTTPS